MKIAACWIVKNEAKELALSLKSVRNGVDEMVVVDTGSTDGSAEVAAELGAKVLHFDWIDDFASARNYGLDNTDADLVIILDADEYFEPEFGPRQKNMVIKHFKQNPECDYLAVVFSHIDSDTKLFKMKQSLNRIYNMNNKMRFVNRIHEVMLKESGGVLAGAETELQVMHTGYSSKIVKSKLERNIRILEEQLEDENTKGLSRYMAISYLMREYTIINDYPKAYKILKLIMADSNFFGNIARYTGLVEDCSFSAMDTAARLRNKISRREIYQKIVKRACKCNPDIDSLALLELFYIHNFTVGEDIYTRAAVAELPMASSADIGSKSGTYIARAESLYAWLAEAAWRRNDVSKAFEYVSAMLIHVKDRVNYTILSILMGCLRGQPEADIIVYLDSMFGTANKEKLQSLLNILREEGSETVYYYYFKKIMESGGALKAEFLYIQLLQGQYDNLLSLLEKEKDEIEEETLALFYMLVAICTDQPEIIKQKSEEIKSLEHIVKAYFSNSVLEEPTEEDFTILNDCYYLLVRISPEKAQRLSNVFSAEKRGVYLNKTLFFKSSMRWEEMAAVPLDGLEQDAACVSMSAYAYLKMEKYQQAYDLLASCEEKGRGENEWYNNLLVIVEKAEPELASKAREMYDIAVHRANELTDMNDVANIGVAYDDASKQERKRLLTITAKQINDELSKGDAFPVDDEPWWDTMRKAADVYIEQRMYAMAFRCYMRMASAEFNREETLELLADLMELVGNHTACEDLRAMA